jgi:hypothetical protein
LVDSQADRTGWCKYTADCREKYFDQSVEREAKSDKIENLSDQSALAPNLSASDRLHA